MKSNKYTLDRFEGDIAVFLKSPEEVETLHIPILEIHIPLKEGDIVELRKSKDSYIIEPLTKETHDQKMKVEQLLERLKNKE